MQVTVAVAATVAVAVAVVIACCCCSYTTVVVVAVADRNCKMRIVKMKVIAGNLNAAAATLLDGRFSTSFPHTVRRLHFHTSFSQQQRRKLIKHINNTKAALPPLLLVFPPSLTPFPTLCPCPIRSTVTHRMK